MDAYASEDADGHGVTECVEADIAQKADRDSEQKAGATGPTLNIQVARSESPGRSLTGSSRG